MNPLILAAALVRPTWLFERLYRARPYGDALRHWALSLSGDTMLELACGPGGLVRDLSVAGRAVTGLDRSAAMVRAARRSAPDATIVTGDATATGLPAAGFDAVLSASLINLVPDPAALLAEMARLARPGGVVSVFFPGPGFGREAAATAAREARCAGLERALLTTWATSARKLAPESVSLWMRNAGLTPLPAQSYFGGTVHAVSGRRGTAFTTS